MTAHPFYNVPENPKVLYKADGFEICKYPLISKYLLIHRCKQLTDPRRVHRVIEEEDGGWICTHCGERPPEDVITVHIMMDGARIAKAPIETADGEAIGEVLC